MTAMPTLGTLIAWIESAGNPEAIRFEPAVFARIHPTEFKDEIVANIRRIHKCTYETACVIYASSFTQYQIMGENLYDPHFLNCALSIFDLAAAPGIQTTLFYRFCDSRKINFTIEQMKDSVNQAYFASRYNGSLDYVQNIKNSLTHFGVK